jgi:hypothetical protein
MKTEVGRMSIKGLASFASRWAAACLGLAVLTACGGGSAGTEGDDEGAFEPAPEGFYQGHFTKNGSLVPVAMVVLENGAFYLDSNEEDMDAGSGTSRSRSGVMTSTAGTLFGPLGSSVQAMTLKTSFVRGSSLSGVVSTATWERPIKADLKNETGVYNYDTPATLERLQGLWNGDWYMLAYGRIESRFNVSLTGTVQGGWDTCAYQGTMLPRASGKNVYDVRLVFGPTCPQPGAVTTGVAILRDIPGLGAGARELQLMTVDEGARYSFSALGYSDPD